MFSPKNIEEEILFLMYKMSRAARKHPAFTPDLNEPSMLQIGALFTISKGKNTMKEIADELGITMPTATSLIERLVKADFVERIADENDRRVVKIKLTIEGQATLSNAINRKINRAMFFLQNVSDKDKKTLKRIFSELLATVEQSQEE